MYSIIDERKNSINENEYLIPNGVSYNWYSSTSVRDNINLLSNAKIANNGKLIWGILSENTEENRFYATLCNKFYINGNDLSIVLDMFVKLRELGLQASLTKQRKIFSYNLEVLLKMFLSYMSDTDYTYMKVRFKKTFKNAGTKDKLENLLTNICNYSNIEDVISAIQFTFLGDCLYSIYLMNLCSLLQQHETEQLRSQLTNIDMRKQMLDKYLTPYRKNYEKFQHTICMSRRVVAKYLATYEQDINDLLQKVNETTPSLSYNEWLTQSLKKHEYLATLVIGESDCKSKERAEFVNSALTMSNSVALASGNISLNCGVAFTRFFTDLYLGYKKSKLNSNVYNFIQSLDESLQPFEIDILIFMTEYRLFRLKALKKDYIFNTYNVSYLWIMFDMLTFNKNNLCGVFNLGLHSSKLEHVGAFKRDIVMISWLSAYIYINTALKSDVVANNIISALFGKAVEDTYIKLAETRDYIGKIPIDYISDVLDNFYSYCNGTFKYNFRHSNFIKTEDLEKLLV